MVGTSSIYAPRTSFEIDVAPHIFDPKKLEIQVAICSVKSRNPVKSDVRPATKLW